MKREDFKQVQELREAGYSYSRIAVVLGVPKNSVKSYCSRFGIRPGSRDQFADEDGALRCRQCGCEIDREHSSDTKRFCSSECRMRWWNAHRDHATSKVMQMVVCANCNKPFRSYACEHRKYCCHECYITDRFGRGDAHDKRTVRARAAVSRGDFGCSRHVKTEPDI